MIYVFLSLSFNVSPMALPFASPLPLLTSETYKLMKHCSKDLSSVEKVQQNIVVKY
jgi:hypothetical protein